MLTVIGVRFFDSAKLIYLMVETSIQFLVSNRSGEAYSIIQFYWPSLENYWTMIPRLALVVRMHM